MIILGIDPGAKESGWVLWNTEGPVLWEAKHEENSAILEKIERRLFCDDLQLIAIERIRGYGIVAGDDTFDTCEWIGRFKQRSMDCGINCLLIPRKEIKLHLCGNTTTNDKYVRQALIDRFGGTGTKKNPGPLFGISGHAWSALAVAVTAADRIAKEVK